MHQGQLARMIELQPRNTFAVRQDRRLGQPSQLPAVDEGFEDVLLDRQVVVGDGAELSAELWEVLNGLRQTVVGHIVGGGFGPEQEPVPDILLEKAVAVMAANHPRWTPKTGQSWTPENRPVR
jgi:hypothetical protein